MHSSLRYFVILFTLVSLTSCKKPMPDPENIDPIYKSLKALADEKKKAADEAIKSKDTAYTNYLKEKPNTLDKKLAYKEYEKWSGRIAALKQEAHYYEIRAQRRKIEDRVNYLEAFKNDKPWPSPDEYSGWSINRKLADAPRTWGTDIPKLYNNGPAAKKSAPKKTE